MEADGSGTIARRGGDIHEVFASDHLVLKPDNHNFNLFPFRVKEVHDNDKINYYCTSGMTEVESNAWRSKVAANHKQHTKERWEFYKSKFNSNTSECYNRNAREEFEQIDHIIGHALEMMYQIGYHGFFATFDFGC